MFTEEENRGVQRGELFRVTSGMTQGECIACYSPDFLLIIFLLWLFIFAAGNACPGICRDTQPRLISEKSKTHSVSALRGTLP